MRYMNLISNCCISGYIYQANNEELKNPFQWCLIEPKDFYDFITLYNKINFDKYELITSDEHKNTYKMILDKKICIKYIHYVQSNKNSISGHDVNSTDIIHYINEMYKRRLKRMTESPIFLYIDNIHKNNDKITEEIASTNACKIIITNNKNLLKYNNKNTLIILDETKRMIIGKTYPINYAAKYKSVILNFIKGHN